MIDFEEIKSKIGNYKPQTAIILGSGLASIADSISNPIIIEYKDIKDFPQTGVDGHVGRLIIGNIEGKDVLCMQGRFHLYEGHNPNIISHLIKVFKQLGIQELIITNAAGSLNPQIPPTSLMLITDHINFSGKNPLVGKNDNELGARFPDMSNAYNLAMREKIKSIAKTQNIDIKEGVYLMVLGPNFETPAEIRAFRILGADAVGMSTVPEVIAGVHAGLKVMAISAISNFGAGMQAHSLSHEETLQGAGIAAKNLANLIINYIKD